MAVKLRTGGGDNWAPSPEDTPWHQLGGTAAVMELANEFYDQMELHEPELTAVHRQDSPGKISSESRERFGMFLVGWLGGPQEYIEKHGHPRLRMRHGRVIVNTAQRDAWLRSMTRAMDVKNITGGVRTFLDARFAEVAEFLRNSPE